MPFSDSFDHDFNALTGNDPFGWQRRLFGELLKGCIPPALDIPTGLGKTAVMPIWLIALAYQALAGEVRLPRRLVYVVDRRTVVDQATDVAERMRTALTKPEGVSGDLVEGLRRLAGSGENLLSISTLRGELADNRAWQEDPARAGIIVGTVDMIGSRLLFSGYGVTRKMRPVHAGLLGRDSLIVHDEAHLSPAFGSLVKGIAALQGSPADDPRAMQVVDLSATARETEPGKAFALTADEMAAEAVRKRLRAAKEMTLVDPGDAGNRPETLATAAAAFAERKVRVVVYVRTPKLAGTIAGLLEKTHGIERGRIAILTGTIRGHERDQMTGDPGEIGDPDARRRAEVFAGFRSKEGREPPKATEYLVATSAGEVGIDLDADHMVSDLSTLDSMIQRLGRVNRLGLGTAEVRVIDVREKDKALDAEEASDLNTRLDATRDLLRSWMAESGGSMDASPAALRARMEGLDETVRDQCFSRQPLRPALMKALVEAWSMTSLKDHPGRPDVEPWLRGWTNEEPQTRIAWRRVIPVRDDDDDEARRKSLDEYLEDAPIHSSERLQARSSAVADLLIKRATTILRRDGKVRVGGAGDAEPDAPAARPLGRTSVAVVVLAADGDFERVFTLDDLADFASADLAEQIGHRTVIADARLGGLDPMGQLDDKADTVKTMDDEGADGGWAETGLQKIGYRPTIAPQGVEPQAGWKVAFHRSVEAEAEESEDRSDALEWRVEEWFGDGAAEAEPALAEVDQPLSDHTAAVVRWMQEIIDRVAPPAEEHAAFKVAAELHDLGKLRRKWQTYAGNPGFGRDKTARPPLGKFAGRPNMNLLRTGDQYYRHAFGSVRDARRHALLTDLPDDLLRDLALHLIASHHGQGRPVITPLDECDPTSVSVALARDVALRFVRLQKRFGPWGLAWREALLRAADVSASREAKKDRAAPPAAPDDGKGQDP